MLRIMKTAFTFAGKFCRRRIPLVILLMIATVVASAVLRKSITTVNVSDGDNVFTVSSIAGDISHALSSAKLKSNKFRIMSATIGKNVADVSIKYTFPVYVTIGDTTKTVETFPATVSEILSEMGYKLDADDMVQPAADTLIEKSANIDLNLVEYVTGSYNEKIPYSVETVYSSAAAEGTTTLISAGKNGVSQVNYTEKLVNGKSAGRTIGETVTLSAPVNEKKVVGTGKVVRTIASFSNLVKSISTLIPSSPISLDAKGVPVNYSKHMTVQATAYTYTGRNCATGVAPQPGYIAVNPKVIPYGTKMYIVSSDGRFVYGYAIAADTGGFTRSNPNNVDLFMGSRSACTSFGRRNIEIYILN